MKCDVFISYCHADDEKARAIADFLQRMEIRCWIDQSGLRLSEGYDEKISRAIRGARVVLWLASEASLDSDYVQHEISTALAHRKPIGPVFLEPLGPDALKPPFALSESRVHGIEYFKEPVEERLATLIDDLRPLIRRRHEWVRSWGLGVLGLAIAVALGWIYLRPAPAGKRPAIAVLPFTNSAAEDEFLAEGIEQGLVKRLTDFRALPVIAPHVAASFPSSNAGRRAMSDEYDVGYLVSGSVQRSGDRVRIGAGLADAKSGEQIWSEQFDEELRGDFQLQDEVTAAIVGQVAPELLDQERKQAIQADPMDPVALEPWEVLLQGDWHIQKLTREDVGAARILYQRAAELDPQLAEAFGGLAMTHVHDVIHGWSEDPPRSLELARAAANQAVEHDRKLASAHAALGATYLIMGKHREAVTSLERAKTLRASYAIAHSLLATALALEGRGEEAVESIESAIRLSPRDAWMFYFLSTAALAHFSAGSYEAALRFAEDSIGQNPSYPLPHYIMSASLGLLGKVEKSRAASEQARRIDPQGGSREMIAAIFASAHPEVRKRWSLGMSIGEQRAEH